MFFFWQTYEGFQITYKSIPECVSFLLSEGMEFTLTERFCQDTLEEYFGNQSKIVGRSENPDIFQFGYNDNTTHIQRMFYILLHASNAMFHIFQATHMVGMIGSVAGKVSLMMLFEKVNLKARH